MRGYSMTNDEIFTAENLTLETERLHLRLIDLADTSDVFEFTSDAEVEKLTGMFSLHKDLDETAAFIQTDFIDQYKQHKCIPWAVMHKSDNKVIGIVQVCNYKARHFRGELGYTFARSCWGKGIATEAAQAAIDFGFNVLGLHRIEATVDPRNMASKRVLEKCGFQYEGLLRDCYFLRNEFCDRMVFALLSNTNGYRIFKNTEK